MRKLCFLLFLFSSSTLFGQIKHQIKIDLLGGIYKDVNLGYEVLTPNLNGYQLDFRYSSKNDKFKNGNAPINQESEQFNQDYILLRQVYKKYFQRRKIYIGVSMQSEFLVRASDRIEEVYSNGIEQSKMKSIGLGIPLGGKFYFFKERFFLEPEYSIAFLFSKSFTREPFTRSFGSNMLINLGIVL